MNIRLDSYIIAILGFSAVLLLWFLVANSAFIPWNSIRTFLGVAVGDGISTYLGADNRSIFGQYYPPLGWWFYSPSALADSPTGSIKIAALLNLTFITVAIGTAMAMRNHVRTRTALLFSTLVVLFMWLMIPTTFYLSSQIHIDSVALCLLTIAIYLAFSAVQDSQKTWMLCTAAVFLSASIWVKQTMLFALPAFYLLLWPNTLLKNITLFSGVLAASLGLLTAIMIANYGYQNLAFHIIELPGATPIVSPFHAFTNAAVESSTLGLCLIAAILLIEKLQNAEPSSKSLKNLTKLPESWHLLFALAFLPISIWSRMRYGGNVNSLLFVPFLLFALGHSLAKVFERDRSARPLLRSLASFLCVIAFIKVGLHFPSHELKQPVTASWHRLISTQSQEGNPSQQAFDYLKRNTEPALFPSFPLSHWLADQTAIPFEVAVCEREIIFGRAVNPDRISDLIGFQPSSIYYPQLNKPKCRYQHYMVTQFFRDFEIQHTTTPALPYWTKYVAKP